MHWHLQVGKIKGRGVSEMMVINLLLTYLTNIVTAMCWALFLGTRKMTPPAPMAPIQVDGQTTHTQTNNIT